jgi:serine/threonine protein kinase
MSENSSRALRVLNRPPLLRPAPVDSTDALVERQSAIPSEIRARVDRFVVAPFGEASQKVLGVGGFSEVTREEDPKTKRQIAVKWISATLNMKSLRREVESLVDLQHPCIVRFLGWFPGDDSRGAQIHLEYAPNGSVSAVLSEYRIFGAFPGFWTRTQVGIVICDIVLGMRYVHSRGIVHRDLKPANILLGRAFRGMICDFGLSRPEYVKGAPTNDAVTYRYAAPEQLYEDFHHTPQTDVFSFGLVLYEIIGNIPVFDGSVSLAEVVRRLRDHRLPTIPDTFGPLMQKLIPRCWLSAPRHRPSFQDIFREFESAGFDILPHADASVIKEAVSKVIAWEQSPGRGEY